MGLNICSTRSFEEKNWIHIFTQLDVTTVDGLHRGPASSRFQIILNLKRTWKVNYYHTSECMLESDFYNNKLGSSSSISWWPFCEGLDNKWDQNRFQCGIFTKPKAVVLVTLSERSSALNCWFLVDLDPSLPVSVRHYQNKSTKNQTCKMDAASFKKYQEFCTIFFYPKKKSFQANSIFRLLCNEWCVLQEVQVLSVIVRQCARDKASKMADEDKNKK